MERDWEEFYRQGDTPWDKGEAAPPLFELMERMGYGMWGEGAVLVPGCGTGHDVRAIAATGVEVVGVDIAPSAVGAARDRSVVGREVYQIADFLGPEWPGDRIFSGLWEHTCFCAISPGRRRDYAMAAARSLEVGGVLAGVFYLNPWDVGEEREGPPHEVTVEEILDCFSPWFEQVEGWVPNRSYSGREGKEWIGVFRRLSIDGSI
jgi:SAM-dependent methyltransferase